MDILEKQSREQQMQDSLLNVDATPLDRQGDDLPEEESVTEAVLMADTSFSADARKMYQFMHGKPFQGSDVEAGRYGISAIGEVYWNMTGSRTGSAPLPFMDDAEAGQEQETYLGAMPMFVKVASEGSPEIAASVVNMLGKYDRLPNLTGRGTFRAVRGIMHDYLTYTGLGFVGAKGVAGMSGRQGAIQAFEELSKGVISNRFKSAAVLGAGYSSAYDAGLQTAEIQGAAFDPSLEKPAGERALQSGVSTAVGATIGAAIPAAMEGAVKGAGYVVGDVARRQAGPDAELGAIGPKADEVSDRDQLKQVLDIRSQQMELKPADRLQPSGENPLFDTSEAGYAANMPEQIVTPVPRAPEGAKLPKGNRASGVVEKTEEIAQRLAERMKPYLGTPAQYFYNTGPIIAKAEELGIPVETAREQLKKFALNYAATSPRTMTEQNLRNASLVSAKQSQGIPIDEIVGGGGTGINEKGYPMMIGPSGIHRKLIDAAAADGIDVNTNPKPATFAENVMGNLDGVTVDTHAVRGALDAMNEIEPGSIPEGFILPEFRAQYKSDPSSFAPAKMVDDTMASQKVDGVSMQTEYAVFSDLYRRAGEILGVSPAEAQSLGWFGSGDRTGLGSDLKTVVDLIDDRVDVTAKALGKTKDEVFVGFMSGKIPLLSVGGLTLMETGSMMEEAQDGNL
jgi:hypothetical protein